VLGDRYKLLHQFSCSSLEPQVCTALDTLSDDRVVLTFWPTNTPSAARAIQQSIDKRAELKHPGVIPIREVLTGEDHVVVVSDVVDGVPLRSTHYAR
jgi:hypothetical protein